MDWNLILGISYYKSVFQFLVQLRIYLYHSILNQNFSWVFTFPKKIVFYYLRIPKEAQCLELELAAIQAMSAVLCCGSVFDPSGLNEDGYIYIWLNKLLTASDEKVRLDQTYFHSFLK